MSIKKGIIWAGTLIPFNSLKTFDMTNVMITPVSTKPDAIPVYSNLSINQSSKLQKLSLDRFGFMMNIVYSLRGHDTIEETLTTDISFIKDMYHKNTYMVHIRELISYNLIIKTGSRKSWNYMVNPAFFHRMNYPQQKEYRARLRSLFPNKIRIA